MIMTTILLIHKEIEVVQRPDFDMEAATSSKGVQSERFARYLLQLTTS